MIQLIIPLPFHFLLRLAILLWSVLEGLQVVLNNVFSLPGAVDIVAVENEHQHWPERLTFWCETPRLFIK